MEQIWGTSSWKLNYTKYEDHIRLNAAVTRDRDAALGHPQTLRNV